jgi:hypothetical protein
LTGLPEAAKPGYGAYTLVNPQQVRKPGFVVTDTAPLAPPAHNIEAHFENNLGVIGYRVTQDKVKAGGQTTITVYWKSLGPLPDTYTGFVHLTRPDGNLAAQDDHELGRGFYRTIVWQAGEIIREKYILDVPKDAPAGEYKLQVGAYSFPSLRRLNLNGASVPAQDNMIELGALRVVQPAQ